MSQAEEVVEPADVGDNSVSRDDLSPLCLCSKFQLFIGIFNYKYFQNGSSSDTTSSRGKEGDFESKILTDRSKRFDFLLKQTEIFSHFMSNTPKSGSSPPKPKAGRPKKIKEPSTESSAVE